MLALALRDEAFDAEGLMCASRILDLDVWGPNDSMPLRWKEEKLKVPIFRRIQGGIASPDEPMEYSKLNYDIGRQSLDSGHEKRWTARFFRRGAANAADGR